VWRNFPPAHVWTYRALPQEIWTTREAPDAEALPRAS
jgi:hypothetical protein